MGRETEFDEQKQKILYRKTVIMKCRSTYSCSEERYKNCHDQGEKQFQRTRKAPGLRKRPGDQWDFNFLDKSTEDIYSTITKTAFWYFKVEYDYFFNVQ